MDGSGDLRWNNLQPTCQYYRQLFEDRSQLTWQEEHRIRNPQLVEYVSLLKAQFWKDVDKIVEMYFKMTELHQRRIMIEKKINGIWEDFMSPPKEIQCSFCSEFSCKFRDDTSSEKSLKRNPKNTVKDWYKSRIVRYKIASEFAGELRLAILNAIEKSTLNSLHSVLLWSPTFSMLQEKMQWFRSQLRILQNNIKHLLSCHFLSAELNSDQFSRDQSTNLTEKKMKPKLKRKKAIKSIL
nr:uncharacterized protein LOC106690542 isoform X2 [Halyomorpha halys]